jgi:ribosomal protein S17E
MVLIFQQNKLFLPEIVSSTNKKIMNSINEFVSETFVLGL